MRKFLVRYLVIAVLWATFPYITQAQSLSLDQQPVSSEPVLRLSPILIEDEAAPGETITAAITVENRASVHLPIKAYAVNFEAKDEFGGLNFFDEQRPESAKQWFSVSPSDVILDPEEMKTVHVSVQVPTDAEPGGRYVTVFFQPLLPQDIASQANISVESRIGVLFFLTVKGNITRKASLNQFRTSFISPHTPVHFRISLQNNGNVHIRPTGTLSIESIFGRQVDRILVHEQGSLTALPGKTRTLDVVWKKSWRFGLYRANLDLDGGPDIKFHKQQLFLVFPYPTCLLLLVVIWLTHRTRPRWKKAWQVLTVKERPS